MLNSPTPLRRYTPPTCTLEIWPIQSSRFSWLNRPDLSDWRFILYFDDPRLSEAEHISVRGDRNQLQLLCDAASGYVKNFLQQTQSLITNNNNHRIQHTPTVNSDISSEQVAIIPIADLPIPPSFSSDQWLSHKLSFGSLAPEASKPEIKLTPSQLFDLVNALNHYQDESSSLGQTIPQKRSQWWWIGAITTSVAAIGLLTFAYRYFQDLSQNTDPITIQPEESPQSDLIEVLPLVPPPPPQPIPSPKLPKQLAQQQKAIKPTPVKPRVPRIVLPKPTASPPPPSSSSNKQSVVLVPEKQPQQPNNIDSELVLTPPPPLIKPAPPPSVANSGGKNTLVTVNPGNGLQPDSAKTSASPSPLPQSSPNLLDTIPQVTEARNYFHSRWTVPQGLNQRIEYRLTVNADGTLTRIIPLGRAAEVYLDRTGIPLLGEPFVSPLKNQDEATLRLVLLPDNKVKTFLEN